MRFLSLDLFIKKPEKKLEDDKPLPVVQARLEDFY